MQKIKTVSPQLYRAKERNRIMSKAKKSRHNSYFATYVKYVVNFFTFTAVRFRFLFLVQISWKDIILLTYLL